ncbi:MAG: ATP-binding cassette domain-containing protein [Dehalococcoidales bacterium]|jgi:ABC-2 type transport system ATP-binding protein
MIVEVEHLTKSYGPIKAVDDISFQVRQGEVFGMLGPNGAGKTTTVEIIEGLRQADSGRVLVLGLDITRAPDKIKQKIGIQLQAPSLLPLLRLEELLGLFAGFFKHSLPVDEVLGLLALKESRKVLVKNLSGGQQQRLSVAMALINDPEITFLDEPTTGLDPQARRGLWAVIESMSKKGKTIFLTTHYMEEAERLCDRVAIIDHGQIIALGSPQELIREHFEEKAIQFEMEPPPPEIVLRTFPGTTNVAIDINDVVIYSNDITATMSAVLKYAEKINATRQLKDLHVREASLEDVFLKLTGRRIRE